jgi:translation initiation factor IF-3
MFGQAFRGGPEPSFACGGLDAIKVTTRINQHIRAPQVRLVGHDGEQIGIVPLAQALELAKKSEMDLVEVAPNAKPPVCKVMDFGRLIYEQKRRLKESRKKARHLEMKEIKMRPNTDTHDYQTKLNHAKDFLEKGHKVKFTIMYRGREMAHFSRGTDLLNRTEIDLNETADIESRPSARGRTQSMVVAPKKTAKAKKDAAEAAE